MPRWDQNYSMPEVINDPSVVPAYMVTDVERAYWNSKQDALDFDAQPTPHSDKMLISGTIYDALEACKVSAVDISKAYYNACTERLAEAAVRCEALLDDIEEYTAFVVRARDAAALSEQHAAASELNAEAWAVGTKEGTPVPSTDPAYQHNAKYYADALFGALLNVRFTLEDGEVYINW